MGYPFDKTHQVKYPELGLTTLSISTDFCILCSILQNVSSRSHARSHTIFLHTETGEITDTDATGDSQAKGASSAIADVSNTSDSSETYADAAKKGKWLKPKSRKRKWGKKDVPVLMSATEVSYKELYVQELDYTRSSGREDFEDMVYAHCMRKGVKPIDLSMIPVRGTRLKAGCKVTIHESHYKQASIREFWPRGAEVRDWVTKPKNNDGDDDDSTDKE